MHGLLGRHSGSRYGHRRRKRRAKYRARANKSTTPKKIKFLPLSRIASALNAEKRPLFSVTILSRPKQRAVQEERRFIRRVVKQSVCDGQRLGVVLHLF